MYQKVKVVKMQLFDNTEVCLTAAQVKKKTGCTHVMNGWVFTGHSYTHNLKNVNWLIIDGNIVCSDEYHDYGLSGNKTGSPTMSTCRSNSYFISGVPLMKNGQALVRSMTPDVKRPAERTAIGWLKDGTVLLWCDKMILSPSELRDRMSALGCVDILMFDGGGSTQGIFGAEVVSSSRIVANYICLWVESEKPTYKYPVPTRTLKYGMSGDDVKWLQDRLNIKNSAGLPVNGGFWDLTKKAVISFQKKEHLGVDGIVGPQTRKALM